MFLAVLFYFLYVDLKRVQIEKVWKSSIRGQFRVKHKLSFWDEWVTRAKIAQVPLKNLLLLGITSLIILSILLTFAEESVIFGCIVSLAVVSVVFVGYVQHRYDQFKTTFTNAFFNEAVPIASHSLRASGQLESSFEEVAAIARNKRIVREFSDLAATWKQKGSTPADTFLTAALGWGVPEIVQLAVITKECLPYHTDLADLWLGFKAQVDADLQRKRMLLAKTRQGRRNGLIYSGIVVTLFAVAYPRLHVYLPYPALVGFWVALGIVLTGTFLIWRIGSRIFV